MVAHSFYTRNFYGGGSRRRSLVAIGTHDLDTLEPPFTYEVGGMGGEWGMRGPWESSGKVQEERMMTDEVVHSESRV